MSDEEKDRAIEHLANVLQAHLAPGYRQAVKGRSRDGASRACAASADDAVAEAMLLKRPPAIVQALHDERLAEAREVVLDVLVARGLDVSESVRVEVSRCADLAQLKRWLRRAVTATSAVEAVDLSGPLNDTEASG
ncbi:hypothetical protein [Sorangium sp. So ce693]|uniref:hypothetical protein n=1 Tax=Sorangium sp. So ce693 TaxID=3133318 RepID=UPI003F60353B